MWKNCALFKEIYTGLSVIKICAMFYIWLQQIQHLSKVTTLLVKANCRCSKLIFLHFRDRGLPCRLHLGALQPQEEQAAAHRQPEQEDDYFSGMVSRENHFLLLFWGRGQTNNFVSQLIFPTIARCALATWWQWHWHWASKVCRTGSKSGYP